MPKNGCVIFAKDVKAMSAFYHSVLGMRIEEQARTHHVLSNEGIELVIHGISKKIADTIRLESPPELRVASAMKPAFIVASLDDVRLACKEYGGGLKPKKGAWSIRGATVLDGWDPEGNVIQFKQFN